MSYAGVSHLKLGSLKFVYLKYTQLDKISLEGKDPKFGMHWCYNSTLKTIQSKT